MKITKWFLPPPTEYRLECVMQPARAFLYPPVQRLSFILTLTFNSSAFMMQLERYQFKTPSSILIAGSSMSGKTTFCQRLIKHRSEMFDKEIDEIYFVYNYKQPFFEKFPFVNFTREIPNNLDVNRRSLVIFDDCMSDNKKLAEIANFFTAVSHHMNASVIFITQNLFLNNSFYRTISQNATAIVIFRSPRIADQLRILSRQIFGDANLLQKVYMDETKEAYRYILLDLSQESNPHYRIRARVLPNESPQIVYET